MILEFKKLVKFYMILRHTKLIHLLNSVYVNGARERKEVNIS